MAEKILKRSFFQRLLGRPATNELEDAGCWEYKDGGVVVDLNRAPELAAVSGAIRLEGNNLPKRMLVIHGDDDQYHAFHNCCTHGKRRLDPVPGANTVQCCSLGKSTFDYDGKLLAGSAKEDIVIYEIRVDGNNLVVKLQ